LSRRRPTNQQRREVEVCRCPCIEPVTGLRCEAVLVNLRHAGRCWSVPRNAQDLPSGRRVFWTPATPPAIRETRGNT